MMDASIFISRRLRFRGNIAVISIAISFLVMIIAVAVSSGFRHQLRSGIARISGDIQIVPPDMNPLDPAQPVERDAAYVDAVASIDGVGSVIPVVYRAGIVKSGTDVHGVLFKGVPDGPSSVTGEPCQDSLALQIAIPERLSEITGIGVGDRMLTYFVGDNVKLRQFNVTATYDPLVQTDDRLVVYCSLSDLQRVDGWGPQQVSAMEIMLDESHSDEASINEAVEHVGAYVNAYSSDSEAPVIAVSSLQKYPQLYDWLNLLDFNVFFILLLMTAVAGFNMISGLLIMLFENIPVIGLLKALGMKNWNISRIFLSSSAVLVAKGMIAGNLIAFAFCIIQNATHVLKLNPENYFVSYVPVHIDFASVILADIAVFAVVMVLLLIPCMFIYRVDPAETVRMK